MAGLVTRKSGLTDLRALYEIATAAGRSCACHPLLAKSHETKDVDARAPRGMTKHQEGGMAALQQRTEIRDGMRIDWNADHDGRRAGAPRRYLSPRERRKVSGHSFVWSLR